ncbi:MAG TPA: HypC/HybG/HupF family hydrogenase formation chaperone, partial [Acidimicrobiia bacterium]
GPILSVDDDRHEAVVDVDGAPRTVSLAVLALEGGVPGPGDWVVVHTGFAVEVLDERAVADLLALRAEMREGDARG